MKLLSCRAAAALAALLLIGLLCAVAKPAAAQQPYRNLVNMRFRTISNGPQSALIVDVKDANDQAAVHEAVLRQYQALQQARAPLVQRELAFLRQHHGLQANVPLDIGDTVILRQNGRLVLPRAANGLTRAVNDLTFTIPTSGTGGWSAQDAATLQSLVNAIYPDLKNVLGAPGWSGNVTILNEDPNLGKVSSVIGALLVINGNNVQIWFPSFTAFQTQFLAMAQVMAQAFHAHQRIAYDAWEQGMGRAAALVCARDLQSVFTQGGQAVSAAGSSLSFYYTPYYDLLNQPALGNNTFTPPTPSNQPLNQNTLTTLGGMLVPRLQMAPTAWLKCYIENQNFFKSFNTAYYAAYATDATIANDVNRLRELAAAAVPAVETLPFDDWFEQQYVLDTSVTQGRKLYVYTQPTFPENPQGDDNGVAAFLVYYSTISTGDEQAQSGQVIPVYWDYTYAIRLSLQSGDQATISNGFGSIAPFFTNIGGNPPNQMRVSMDFPVNKEYVRVPFPAGETGTETTPNDVSGVVVGANSGALKIAYIDGGGTISTQVQQGAFGAHQPSAVPIGFSRAQITYTPTGGQAVTFQRNTAFNNTYGIAPIFVLSVPGQVTTLSHQFAAGPQMIALPVQPLTSDLAKVLGSNPNTTLLAQWRQDLTTTDKYLRYPTLPLYEPGYGLWSDFSTTLNATSIQGQRTDNQQAITVALQFGWNQIGSPYATTDLNATTDLQVQYLTDNSAVSFQQAVQNGWIAAGIIGYDPTAGYEDITGTPTTLPQNTLQSWKGYWVRVLVTEGVSLTYQNPTLSAAARTASSTATRSVSRAPTRAVATTPGAGGWQVPLILRDAAGHATTATFGQASQGSTAYISALDVASPPPFPGASTLGIRFPHTDWNAGTGGSGGDFLTDIRRSATRAEWDMTVTVPESDQSYTLAWNNTATLPRGTRLMLKDMATGATQLMNSVSGYTFRATGGATTRQFQILAEPRMAGTLFITNVIATPTFAGGRALPTVNISYELSTTAQTRLEIQQLGRPVRHLVSGRAATPGINQMVWDTRDDQGRILPAGVYTLAITALTPEGEQTRAIVPLLLAR